MVIIWCIFHIINLKTSTQEIQLQPNHSLHAQYSYGRIDTLEIFDKGWYQYRGDKILGILFLKTSTFKFSSPRNRRVYLTGSDMLTRRGISEKKQIPLYWQLLVLEFELRQGNIFSILHTFGDQITRACIAIIGRTACVTDM